MAQLASRIFAVQDVTPIIDKLEKHKARLVPRLKKALEVSGARVLQESVPITPRLHGFLRASLSPGAASNVFEFKNPAALNLSLEVGSNLPYAAEQEYNETFHHDQGEWGYLRKGLARASGFFKDMVAVAMRVAT